MILKWGKPSQFQKAAANTALNAASGWTDMALPKENSLKINSQDGQENTATEEGGEIVDVRYGKSTYTIEWDEYDRDDVGPAFEDTEGIVADECALRILPEDDSLTGFYIPRCRVRVTTNYTTQEGMMRHYNIRALKPSSGLSVQPYKKAGSGS